MHVRRTSRLTPEPNFTVDVVLLSPAGSELAVLLQRAAGAAARGRWRLPQDVPRGSEPPERTAQRIARGALRSDPSWLEQLATFRNPRRNPARGALTVAYLGLVPSGVAATAGDERRWFAMANIPTLTVPERDVVAAALKSARERMDHAPVAFRMLPPTFTLSELQSVYEILLGRKIHKASFRRSLQAAWLVEPVDEWRTEGRGRPAQLYRYAPRRRRSYRRSVRFDRLV